MPEDKASIMREFVKTWEAADVEKSLALFNEDAVVTEPLGTFRGRDAIRHSLAARFKTNKNTKVIETGNGIIGQGNKAFFEFTISTYIQSKNCEFLVMCAYEISDGKFKTLTTVYDRLLIAQQVAPWPASILVNVVVNQSNKAMK